MDFAIAVYAVSIAGGALPGVNDLMGEDSFGPGGDAHLVHRAALARKQVGDVLAVHSLHQVQIGESADRVRQVDGFHDLFCHVARREVPWPRQM